jgi:hypothetical protein
MRREANSELDMAAAQANPILNRARDHGHGGGGSFPRHLLWTSTTLTHSHNSTMTGQAPIACTCGNSPQMHGRSSYDLRSLNAAPPDRQRHDR